MIHKIDSIKNKNLLENGKNIVRLKVNIIKQISKKGKYKLGKIFLQFL